MGSEVHWCVERCPEVWGVLTYPSAFASPGSPSAFAQHRGTAKGPGIAFGLEGAHNHPSPPDASKTRYRFSNHVTLGMKPHDLGGALGGVSPHPTCAGVSQQKTNALINSVLTNTESTIWWATGLDNAGGWSQGWAWGLKATHTGHLVEAVKWLWSTWSGFPQPLAGSCKEEHKIIPMVEDQQTTVLPAFEWADLGVPLEVWRNPQLGWLSSCHKYPYFL